MKLPRLITDDILPEDEARKIIRRAKRRARKIIEDARQEARLQVADADKLKLTIQEEFRTHLKEVAERVSASITEEALIEVNKFNQELKERVASSQQAEKALVAEEFDEAKKEIEEYKKQRMAEIDEKIAAVIKDVTKKYLGEAVNPDQHKDLVLKALEDAKRRNLL